MQRAALLHESPRKTGIPLSVLGLGGFYGLERSDLNKLVQYGGFDYHLGFLVGEWAYIFSPF
ncbi:MAG: hypothetical protein OHK0019_13510 [Saprospiraceae bacterium]